MSEGAGAHQSRLLPRNNRFLVERGGTKLFPASLPAVCLRAGEVVRDDGLYASCYAAIGGFRYVQHYIWIGEQPSGDADILPKLVVGDWATVPENAFPSDLDPEFPW